jgi:hypothetical protein
MYTHRLKISYFLLDHFLCVVYNKVKFSLIITDYISEGRDDLELVLELVFVRPRGCLYRITVGLRSELRRQTYLSCLPLC